MACCGRPLAPEVLKCTGSRMGTILLALALVLSVIGGFDGAEAQNDASQATPGLPQIGTPSAASLPQIGSTTGVVGATYVSPTYGYRLEWDEAWSVLDETSSENVDRLVLGNGVSEIAFVGSTAYEADAEACVAGEAAGLEAGGLQLSPTQGTDGQLLRGGDSVRAWAVYVASSETEAEQRAVYLECRMLDAAATVAIRQFAPLAAYNEQAAPVGNLVDALTLASAATSSEPTPAPAVAATPAAPPAPATEEPAADEMTEASWGLAGNSYTSADGWTVSWDEDLWEPVGDPSDDYLGLSYSRASEDVFADFDLYSESDDYGDLFECALSQWGDLEDASDYDILAEDEGQGFASVMFEDQGAFVYAECQTLASGDGVLGIFASMSALYENVSESDFAEMLEDVGSVVASIEGTEVDGTERSGPALDGSDEGREERDRPSRRDRSNRRDSNESDAPSTRQVEEPESVNDPTTDDDGLSAPGGNTYGGGLEDLLPTERSAVYFWQPGQLPALYQLKGDGTGLRTTYPTGSLQMGQPGAFAWYMNEDTLVMQYASGYVDMMRILGYDSGADILMQEGSQQGPDHLYGCRSGQMPPMIAGQLC